jgi:hypothetical protein
MNVKAFLVLFLIAKKFSSNFVELPIIYAAF